MTHPLGTKVGVSHLTDVPETLRAIRQFTFLKICVFLFKMPRFRDDLDVEFPAEEAKVRCGLPGRFGFD